MEFRILGPLEVRVANSALAIRGAGQRALLARLLLDANRVVSVDGLVADLWDAPPRSGVKALQQRVVELRRDLETPSGGQLIHTREPGYVLELAQDALDLHRFETLLANGSASLEAGRPAEAAQSCREALELWRGQPLAEFDAPFAAAARARLEELYLVGLGIRLESDLGLGRHDGVIGELRELAAAHPFREGFRVHLILAL